MKVEFVKDVFVSGTKAFAVGQIIEGDDLAKYVRRGQAVESKKPVLQYAREEADAGGKADQKGGTKKGKK